MPPPGLLAAPRSGGTTSPSKSELIGAARVILDNCGVQFSQNKIVRLVLAMSADDSWGTVPVDSHIAMATEGVDLDAMFAAIDAAEAVSA